MRTIYQRNYHTTVTWSLVLCLIGLFPAAVPPPENVAFAIPQNAAVAQVEIPAAKTRVFLLPIVNRSAEKDPKQRVDQAKNGDAELRKLFIERGFKVVDSIPDESVTPPNTSYRDATGSPVVEAMKRVGVATGADVIIYAVVTDVSRATHRKVRHSTWRRKRLSSHSDSVENFPDQATVRLWLYDRRRDVLVLDAQEAVGSSRGSSVWMERHSIYMRRAVGVAVRKSLEGYLQPFPILPPGDANK